jgi:uncharacterized membrane protein YedE/YeeE
VTDTNDFSGLAPRELFTWSVLFRTKGFVSVIVGGFLVGFGTAYAGGCTSGHAITGLADRWRVFSRVFSPAVSWQHILFFR